MELEPDLVASVDAMQEADHIVFVFPNWWASFPALLKGFIDRTFLPGIVFEYVTDSILPKKLLKGKSARLVITMDSPKWYYKFYVKQPAVNMMKKGVLQFCGVNPVKVSYFSPMKSSSLTKRTNWMDSIKVIVSKDLK